MLPNLPSCSHFSCCSRLATVGRSCWSGGSRGSGLYADTSHGGSPSIGLEPMDSSRSPDLVEGRALLLAAPFLAFGLTFPRASGGIDLAGAEPFRGPVGVCFLGDRSVVAARLAGCALKVGEGSRFFKVVLFDLDRAFGISIRFSSSSGLFSLFINLSLSRCCEGMGSGLFLGTGMREPPAGLAGASPSASASSIGLESQPLIASDVSGVLGSIACDEFFLDLDELSCIGFLALLWLLSLRGLLRDRDWGRVMPAACSSWLSILASRSLWIHFDSSSDRSRLSLFLVCVRPLRR